MSGNDAPQAPYLKLIKMTSFGAFTNEVVGPFSPHLNVVFGSNEAGKTTLASFVGGVLFGWEEARGNRNTYKPLNAERSGSLFFARDHIGDADEPNGSNEFGEAEEIELARTKNADGLVGDASLVADIDKETFQTMFSLTSDELRSLRNTTDVTAKLLTAGSGTGASPAHALTALQERLAQFTSRAAASEKSLVKLESEQDELRRRIAAESDCVERLKREDREFAELKPQRDELLAKIGDLNTAIETLKANRKTLEKTEADEVELQEKIADLRAQEESLRCEHRLAQREHPEELAGITATEERHLRDRIEALAVQEAKSEHAVDLARDNYATSRAAYEAMLETQDEQNEAIRARRQQRVQIGLSVALPVAFMFAASRCSCMAAR